jgi:hypothetical protein
MEDQSLVEPSTSSDKVVLFAFYDANKRDNDESTS